MSAESDVFQRLRRLVHILEPPHAAPDPAAAAERDAARRLEQLPLDRIRRITAELASRPDGASDEGDALAMRLLLNDYIAAVAQLRAVTRDAADRIDAVAPPVADVRQFVWHEQKLREKRRQSGGPPESA
jgi:hypothetical protein